MRIHTSTLALALAISAFAGIARADAAGDLFAKTHRGAKESKVAGDWYDVLPSWVASLTTKNQFPETHLPYEIDKGKLKNMRSGVNKFQIRDANAKQFSVYLMVRNGVDAQGRPVYAETNDSAWLAWKGWPAKYIVETYPVESNPDDNALVAMGAWLYGEKENELANRVLTVVHKRNSELAPLIEAYICEKEKWELPADGLVEWNSWDIEYQVERALLVTPSVLETRVKDREKNASDAYKELLKARGDYKGRPPRRNSPTMQLVLLEWEIKQWKIKYASSDFAKDPKNSDRLDEIMDSIKDDLAAIKENLERANKLGESGDEKDLKAKAEFLEEILKVDPQDLNLRSQTANAWYEWGNPAPHGNSCDRADGMKKAIPHFEVILQAYPRNTSFLLAIGRCYQALEDSKNARPYYERVIEIDGTKGNANVAKSLIRNMEQKDAARAKQK
jgi:tetratricopeptide (TPR) repeat protein